MTDEYALGVLEGMDLEWSLDSDTGYYIAEAKGGVRLQLKGVLDSPIILMFIIGQLGQGVGQVASKKYRIEEPHCSDWKKERNVSRSRKKLEGLVRQAQEQCSPGNISKQKGDARNELLGAAIGWNS